jgi:hypothetical protein
MTGYAHDQTQQETEERFHRFMVPIENNIASSKPLFGLLLDLFTHLFDVLAGAVCRVFATGRKAHKENDDKKTEAVLFDVILHGFNSFDFELRAHGLHLAQTCHCANGGRSDAAEQQPHGFVRWCAREETLGFRAERFRCVDSENDQRDANGQQGQSDAFIHCVSFRSCFGQGAEASLCCVY